jgi:hypothetical protein
MQYRCCPGFFGENCDMGKLKNLDFIFHVHKPQEICWKYFILLFFCWFGQINKPECFNCTTLERMERRLRTVEETIRGGNGNYSQAGPHQRPFIRPGRPDMSHVTGTTGPRGYDKYLKKLIK